MEPFAYARPSDTGAAVAAVAAEPRAAFIAGGTEIVNWLQDGLAAHSLLVDVNALPLAAVEALPGGGVRIGALARMADVARHPLIREPYRALAEALEAGASAQLRNMATMGGNLMQRTRCPYFRDVAFACNKRAPGSGCAAIGGVNRWHAILGTSDHCIAVHPSDAAVALAALDATVHVQGSAGERAIPFAEFHRLPGDTPHVETALAHGEVITAIELPALPWARRSHYRKVRDRASYEFALVSAAVALDLADGQVRDARVALGGVGTKPWRAREAEASLRGRPLEEQTIAAAAQVAVADATPRPDNAFKVELARRTLRGTLAAVGGLV
jgi:xanthine dehydrogenase YagS FAD-binding subunit